MEIFNNYREAYGWLKSNRYAAPNRRKSIGSTKFYKDIRRGLFPVKDKDAITKQEVLTYAHKAGLIRLDGNANQLDSLIEIEKRERIEFLRIRKQREKFNADRESGKYILKARWLAELVSKLSASKYVAISVARMKAPDLIAAVGGNLKKESLFVEMFINYIEAGYDELAKVPELKFLVKDQSDDIA